MARPSDAAMRGWLLLLAANLTCYLESKRDPDDYRADNTADRRTDPARSTSTQPSTLSAGQTISPISTIDAAPSASL